MSEKKKVDLWTALGMQERECCGTFKGTPHRKTCPMYKGKK